MKRLLALTWALLTDRPRAKVAGILAGAGALLNLAGVAAMVLLGRNTETMRVAREATIRENLVQLVLALEQEHAASGAYPETLQQLVGFPLPRRLLNIHDQSADLFTRRIFEYRVAADGGTYDLFSSGADGRPGTADDLRPTLADSLRESSGYRPGP